MDDNLEIAYRAANGQQAAILKNILADEGIEASVTNIALTSAAGELPVGWSSAPCVMVRQADMERARQIAEEFEEDIAPPASSDDEIASSAKQGAKDDDDADDDHDFEHTPTWDPCPSCGETRRGRCARCGAIDAYFPPAENLIVDRRAHTDGQFGAESFEIDSPDEHYMCSVCDEPMVPEPGRFCGRCGHDYGDGIDLREIEATVNDGISDTSPRVILTFALLGLLGLAGLVYVWWITR